VAVSDGVFDEWDWQMLTHQEQYQQQQSLQQQQQQQQQSQHYEYQQQSPLQPRPQSFHYWPDCQVADRSKAAAFGLSTSAPQIEVPWTQMMTHSDPGEHGIQDLSYTSEAAVFGSGGQQSTSPSHLNWSALSVARNTSDMGSDHGAVEW
jgi:hypothetical protein